MYIVYTHAHEMADVMVYVHMHNVMYDVSCTLCRVRVSSRCEGDRLAVRGIFSGAQVTRGADWRWGDQDGR